MIRKRKKRGEEREKRKEEEGREKRKWRQFGEDTDKRRSRG